MRAMARILVVIPDKDLRTSIDTFLVGRGFKVDPAPDYESAVDLSRKHVFDVALCQTQLPDGTLLNLMEELRSHNEDCMILAAASLDDVADAVQAIKRGAFGIIRKPISVEELEVAIRSAVEIRKLRHETQDLRGGRSVYYRTDYFIGESPEIRKVFQIVDKVTRTDSSVVLQGETGTGKELLAGAFHYSGRRADEPFIKVNCAALPDQLLESELFGHEKGAFTGADRLRLGRFELANGGTLFLDEIGDMSLSTQAKVLRVLQEGEFERLGGTRSIKTNVRIISATNRDLEQMVTDQEFRNDLYYRLNVVTIRVPPLRERTGDVELLARFFLTKLAGDLKKPLTGIHPEAMALLVSYPWPGNVRQLQNAIERAVILTDGSEIRPEDLDLPRAEADSDHSNGNRVRAMHLEEVERQAVLTALEKCGWVQSRAGELLGISRRAINYKIQKHGIQHSSWRINAPASSPPTPLPEGLSRAPSLPALRRR